MNKITSLNIEVMPAGLGSLVFICPKMPPKRIRDQIEGLLPAEVTRKFVEGPKPSTLSAVKAILGQIGMCMAELKTEGRDLKVITSGAGHFGQGFDPERLKETVAEVSRILYKDEYFVRWQVTLNGDLVMSYDRQITDEIAGNLTSRDRVISKGDISDLQIDLGRAQDS